MSFASVSRSDSEIQNLGLLPRLPSNDETTDLTAVFADQCNDAAPAQQLPDAPFCPLRGFQRSLQNLGRRRRVRFAKCPNCRSSWIAHGFSAHAPRSLSRKSRRPTVARNLHLVPARPSNGLPSILPVRHATSSRR